ncbi:hypothetical protein ACLVWU_06055 [Bdellovibrio sp. HCB290]|uniref:hypothetical protein n=1 Tax=Bdellovibrio sp. HCB290 TaxID=3394356 RepID=UPI0039B4001B
MSKKHPKSHGKHAHSNTSKSHADTDVEFDSAVDTDIETAMNEVEEISTASATTSDEINTEAQNEGVSAHPAHDNPDSGTYNAGSADDKLAPEEMAYEGGPAGEEEKAHVEFFGSEIIRQKAPKVMEVADTVVDEWKKDGSFDSLPVGHPLAAMAAGRALRKAKDVEKKLEEKGVFVMAKMGMDYIKSEIEKRRKQ